MQLKFSCYQLKPDSCNYKMFYGSLILITKKTPIAGTKMIKRKRNQNIPLGEKSINSQRKIAREKENNKVTSKSLITTI